MTLDELRHEINQIDESLLKLFKKRMAVSKAIGEYKKQHDLPVLDASREQAIYNRLRQQLDDESLWPYYKTFVKTVMDLSKEIQK